ncbi:MAG: transcription termination factor Rho [Lachnospiraceae bacterium]|nr:transcription termination factor Rho [Lachnospiraceae bacterium]
MREKYESLAKTVLADIASHRGIDVKGMKKADIVEAMLALDEKESSASKSESVGEEKEQAKRPGRQANTAVRNYDIYMTEKELKRDMNIRSEMPEEIKALDSGVMVGGILEITEGGYGFIRSDNFLPGDEDIYVSAGLIKKYRLKTGDYVKGCKRIKEREDEKEKYAALLYIVSVNGREPEYCCTRAGFETLTPVFPYERIHLEYPNCSVAQRIVDLIAPIGKGQRGMIVSPPKAGKTTLLKQVARAVLKNNPEMHLIILLIDERPEEVTDIKEAIQGKQVEVIYSTFDELPEHHKRVSEMVLERAKRLVESGEDVIILLDSITRLTRAYNLTVPPSGRTLTGGLDPASLHMPKKFFGAARKMREGGSLTILATALVETGSKMDDVVFEEFKGTGNMELVLDRKLSEKRIFPAVDIVKSGTRRDDLLLSETEQQAMEIARRALNGAKSEAATETLLRAFQSSTSNRALTEEILKRRMF